jgi:uncharacterized protein (TIGR03000 family)
MSTMKRLFAVALLTSVFVAISADRSDAGWHHSRWYHGYYPSVSYSYYPAYYYTPVYYSPVVYRHHSCFRPSYRYSYSSCWDPCAYTCHSCYRNPCSCYSTSYAPCCGTVINSSVSSKIIEQGPVQQGPTLAEPQSPPETTAPDTSVPGVTVPAPALDPIDPGTPGAPAALEGVGTPESGSTILAVKVPEAAKVYVNGKLTTTPGNFRRYISRGLVPGYRYTYEIRAEFAQAGQTLTDRRVIHVRAGETSEVAFDFDPAAPQVAAAAVNTTLTLHVPDGARVNLGGNDTVSSGSIRQFTTTELARDQQWKDYKIVVTLDRQGKSFQRERSISVSGGESRDLVFDFTEDNLAAR